MQYQINWKHWQWPWWHRELITDIFMGKRETYYCNFAGIGPFQFHWYSSY
jgi:hypothetical protein